MNRGPTTASLVADRLGIRRVPGFGAKGRKITQLYYSRTAQESRGRRCKPPKFNYRLFHNLIRDQERYLERELAAGDKVAGGNVDATRRSDADGHAVEED